MWFEHSSFLMRHNGQRCGSYMPLSVKGAVVVICAYYSRCDGSLEGWNYFLLCQLSLLDHHNSTTVPVLQMHLFQRSLFSPSRYVQELVIGVLPGTVQQCSDLDPVYFIRCSAARASLRVCQNAAHLVSPVQEANHLFR